ncbi:hypothetical protein HJFPF1_12562 [Paramyrothecium foliicola]|nr:hypothetical protein HJFPF1_12562 [Paramyrothecium foliicola]
MAMGGNTSQATSCAAKSEKVTFPSKYRTVEQQNVVQIYDFADHVEGVLRVCDSIADTQDNTPSLILIDYKIYLIRPVAT